MPPRRSFSARAPLGQQHQSDQAEITDQEIIRDRIQRGSVQPTVPTCCRERFSARHSALSLIDDGSAALVKSQHRQGRNQHRGGEQKRRRAPVERLHAQPEIKPDAAVNPGDQQHRVHQPHLVRPYDPVGIEHLRIELFLPEQRLAEPHADDMGDDQRRNAQAEHELQRLDRLPVKLPALVQRPDPQTAVDQRRGIEQHPDRRKLPEHRVVADARSQRLHRDIAERMVEKMADQIGKQHQAAAEADLPHADAAEEFSGSLERRVAVHVILE